MNLYANNEICGEDNPLKWHKIRFIYKRQNNKNQMNYTRADDKTLNILLPSLLSAHFSLLYAYAIVLLLGFGFARFHFSFFFFFAFSLSFCFLLDTCVPRRLSHFGCDAEKGTKRWLTDWQMKRRRTNNRQRNSIAYTQKHKNRNKKANCLFE